MDLVKLFEGIWEICRNHAVLVLVGALVVIGMVLLIVDAQRCRKSRPRHRGGKRH
jgi:hypothetical protein